MSDNTDYDVIVLGGGSAGTSAARAAAQAGARTLMINDGELGGLCILRGCMPTKSLLHVAEAYEHLRHLEPLGISVGERSIDLDAVMARKDRHVARFKRAKINGIESSDYELLDARARFVDAERIEAGGTTYRARRGYVIATGSVPACPPIPGDDQVDIWTSDDALRIDQLPGSIAIQGAGAIGLETAWFFARLGVRTTLINRSRPLSKVDAEFTEPLEQAFLDHADAQLLAPANPTSLAPTASGGVRIELDVAPHTVEVDRFLCAIGRRAAIDDLGLDAAGIEVTRGAPAHDAHLRTTNPRVYVAGDTTGSYQLLHLANVEGKIAGANAARAEGPADAIDYRLQMQVIFTDPPFAAVGQTEQEARAAGREVVAARKRFPEQGRAITMETRHGLAKLVADQATGEILGAQILGPRADDMIHVISSIMYYRGTAADMQRMPWYHPTLTEAFIELSRELVGAVG